MSGKREYVLGEKRAAYGRSFLGIPYGVAGRWEAPRPAAPWHPGILNATSYGPSCVRPDSTGPTSENCLYLNVYAPLHEEGEGRHDFPVVVWIHGGTFIYGSADDLHARNLRELQLTNRVIVVAVDYRLGALGFLASKRMQAPRPSGAPESTPAAVGNYGILDQQLALQWVQQHISFFGGDPKRVGIVGWSSGAASVSLHLGMPSSRGLFSRAVMLSGGFANWAAQSLEKAELFYDRVLRLAGCDRDLDCQAEGPPCACLAALPAERLVEITKAVDWFVPTVDGSLVLHHPAESFRQGKVHAGVPIIIGSAVEDSFVDIGANATDQDLLAYLKTVLPEHSALEAHRLYTDPAVSLDLYSGQRLPSHRGWSPAYWAARRAYADMVITCVARRVARGWGATAGVPAYWYLWGVGTPTAKPQATKGAGAHHNFRVGSCGPCPGAGHGSDLNYLFQLAPEDGVQERAAGLAAVYPALLADFVNRADPNVWHGFSLSVRSKQAWPTAEKGGMWFEANNSKPYDDMRGRVCDFWDAQPAN